MSIPDEKIKKTLLGIAMRKGIHTCLSNHYYTFDGEIRRQSKGGSIGSELTGEVSRLYMLRWDDKFLTKLRKLRLSPQMYVRYVDDTLIVSEVIQPGVRYDSKKSILRFNADLVPEDEAKSDDIRTFEVLRSIADSIDSDIQWEEDVPTNHASNKLPCLDMELWMVDSQVMFQFYSKPMASKSLIHFKSALSSQIKRSSIFSEGMRRLLNCHPDLSWEVKAEFLTDFANSMRISGYNQKYRREMIQGVIKRYNDLIESVQSGSRLLYRSKQMMREAKLAKGGISAASWHLRGDIKQTVNVSITPGAELSNSLKRRIGDMIGPDKGKTLVIEKGGMNLLGGIYKSDPFKKQGCRWNENCIVDGKVDCMDSNLVYKITCKQCGDMPVTEVDTNMPVTESDANMPVPAVNEINMHANTVDDINILSPTVGDNLHLTRRTCYVGQTGRSMHARMKNTDITLSYLVYIVVG